MGQALQQAYVSLADYLQAEREADFKNEYVDGQVYALVGVSEVHANLAGELFAAIHAVLPPGCRVWHSELKLRIDIGHSHFVYYPDLMVACGKNRDDPYYRTDPKLLVEVLSPSTQRIDLHEKFEHYRQIPSLEAYLVVYQDRVQVLLFRRANQWRAEDLCAGDVELASVGLRLPLSTLYRDLDLSQPE